MKRKRRVLIEPPPEPAHPNAEVVPEGQRPCPICQVVMAQETQHNIVVDVCEAHGVWMDKDEMSKMLAMLETKYLVRRRRAVASARRQGQLRGIMYPFWFLLGEP